ncbi:MAG: condensation domain-containing protein [Lutisporaceae bacterium]
MREISKIEKQNIEDVIALTPMQRGILFHYLKNPDSREYFEQLCLRLKGKIHLEIVEKAWKHVVQSNEMLRTVFRWDKLETPVQMVLKSYKLPLRIIDLVDTKQVEKDKCINNIRQKDIEESIDIRIEPMRITLIQIQENEFEMIISNHHILYDGWSNGIIVKEFIEAYKRLYKGLELEHVEKTKFKEYIKWNQAQDKAAQKNYWKKYLEGYSQKISIPRKKSIQKNNDKIGRYQIEIDKTITAAIEVFCRSEKTTMANLLNIAWGILLQRYNNTDDVVFGITISGRATEINGIDNTVGLFINTIPLRIKLEDKENVLELLYRADREARDRESYENASLAEIQAESETGNVVGLFDILLVIENYPIDEALKNVDEILTFEIVDMYTETNYDIAIGITVGEKIRIAVSYNRYNYTREVLENVFKHYVNIIMEMIADASKLVKEIEMIDAEEKKQILYDFNKYDSGYVYRKPVHKLFEDQVEKTPDAIALVFGNESITFRELNKKANQLACFLKKKGIKSDEIIGIMQERSVGMMVSILGVLKSGCTYLPLDPNYPQKRIMVMLDKSDISVMLTTESTIKAHHFTSLQYRRIKETDCSLSCKREQIKEFNNLPIVDRTLVDYEKYDHYIGQAMVKNAIAIQATRGCPYSCAYCHKLWPKSHIVRSAENIFHEVNLYYQEGIRRFVFVDDIFNLDAKNSARFFNLIIENGLKLQIFFPQGLRGDILTKEYIDLMIEAGVVSMALALETASPRLQRLIGKNLNLIRLKENIEYICMKYPGVILELFTMHGFPTETEEEAYSTLEFIKSIKWLHFPYIHILKIYPETEMAKIALENGISMDAIERSVDTAYHEVSETSPFSFEYTKKYQAEFLNEYFLNKERLLKVLPLQIKVLTESELVQKYNSYLPTGIKNFKTLLDLVGIDESELNSDEFVNEDKYRVLGFNKKIEKYFPKKEFNKKALRILLLDLSQYFSSEGDAMLYDVVEPPLGCMYLLTYLNDKFGSQIHGKIAKSRTDFDSYDELKKLIYNFKPDIIGVRSLTYYRDFFHKTISLIRQWGIDAPIIAGGPYATSSYSTVLCDQNIDIVILGEGEITLSEIVQCIMENGGKLPDNDTLVQIPGIAVSNTRGLKERNEDCRHIIMLDHAEELLKNEAVENPTVEFNEESIIYQIYTSGSTGTPKGAMVKHHSFSNLLNWYTSEFDINNTDKMLLIASVSFDLAQKNLYATLIKGGQLYLYETDSYNYEKMSDVIEEKGITIINCTPSAFYPLLELNEDNEYKKLSTLRYVFLGGEPINMMVMQKWIKSSNYHCEVVNTYGPTECTDVISSYRIDNDKVDKIIAVPIGKPIYNTHLYVLDKKLRILPIGVEGELYAGGACVGKGYYKDDTLTKQRFIEVKHLPDKLIYKTGDMVKLLSDGNIEFIGRADNQVKIRGYRIEIGEIEARLLMHKGVKEAAVIVRENEAKQNYICAYVVSDNEIEISDFRKFMKKELPSYMIPTLITRLEKLPLTPSGKVDKKALADPINEQKSNKKDVFINDEIEKKLVDIWCKVLETSNIGIYDNFFELGGHSLKAVQAINLIYKTLNIKISIQTFFECQTIESLGKYLRSCGKVEYEDIEKLPKLDYYDLSYAQKRLWIINQKEPLNTAYNITGKILLNGIVSLEVIQKTFKHLINRHESLRTCIKTMEGIPRQSIEDNIDFEVLFKDLDCIGAKDKATELDEIYKRKTEHVFNLEEAPLFVVELVKLSNEQYELILCMHHIISDGWSMSILKKEFADIYEAYKNGRNLDLEPLKIQYKDYATWQNKQIEDPSKMEAAKNYWLKQLKYEAPLLNISNKYQGTQVKDSGGEVYTIIIDKTTKEKLKIVAKDKKTTLFTVLVAAFNIYLMNFTGQNDILIGTAGSGREHESLEKVIGYFINTTVLRNQVDRQEMFDKVLARINENTLKALEYQNFPLEKIVEEMNIKYPKISIFFNMLNMEASEKREISNKDVYGIEQMKDTKFDMTFYLAEYSNGIELICTYKKTLIKESRIAFMLTRYNELLGKIAENPDSLVADYLD